MERLTYIDCYGWYAADPSNQFENRVRGKAIDRLAAYEDTGLTPEEIKGLITSSALRIDLTDAEVEKLREMMKQRPGTLIMLTAADLNADTCVSCGEIIPDGRQVCPPCEVDADL